MEVIVVELLVVTNQGRGMIGGWLAHMNLTVLEVLISSSNVDE